MINHIPGGAYLIACAVLFMTASAAQTSIYIDNRTPYTLQIENLTAGGDKISKKAWKRGAAAIASGERARVLSFKRAGKNNWMDPTPRFIEPGKTALFIAELSVDGVASDAPLRLRQKLFGVGKTSKMWFSVEDQDGPREWHSERDDGVSQGVWRAGEGRDIPYRYGRRAEKKHISVEYIFGQ